MLLFLLTGRWSGCMSRSAAWNARRHGQGVGHAAGIAGNAGIHESRHQGRFRHAPRDRGLAPRDAAVLAAAKGRKIARRNLWLSIPALLLSFAVWMVWSVVVAKLPLIGFAFTHGAAFLAGGTAGPVGRDTAHLLRLHGADLRRPAVDDAVDRLADAAGHRHRLCRAEPGTRPISSSWCWRCCAALAAANFASSMANIGFFFPKAEKGNALALNAGLGNLGVSVMQFLVPLVITGASSAAMGGAPQPMMGGPALDAECRLHLGAVHPGLDLRGLVRHE
jgi:hypothetical protein